MITSEKELKLGECTVICEDHGQIKRYKNAKVCDIPMSNGETWRVVYFIHSYDDKVIGYEQ